MNLRMLNAYYSKQAPFDWLLCLNEAFQACAGLLHHPGSLDAVKIIGPEFQNISTFSKQDNSFLCIGFEILATLGCPVSTKLRGTYDSLYVEDQPVDFLDTQSRTRDNTPLLFINYIPQTISDNEKVRSAYSKEISPFHNKPNAWRKAAEYDGAEIIVIFGAGTEINPNDFSGGRYDLFLTEKDLLPARIETLPTGISILIDKKALSRREIFLKKKFSKEIKTSVTNNTCLKPASFPASMSKMAAP